MRKRAKEIICLVALFAAFIAFTLFMPRDDYGKSDAVSGMFAQAMPPKPAARKPGPDAIAAEVALEGPGTNAPHARFARSGGNAGSGGGDSNPVAAAGASMQELAGDTPSDTMSCVILPCGQDGGLIPSGSSAGAGSGSASAPAAAQGFFPAGGFTAATAAAPVVVPEPANWAMMIVGMALTGSVLRRRRPSRRPLNRRGSRGGSGRGAA